MFIDLKKTFILGFFIFFNNYNSDEIENSENDKNIQYIKSLDSFKNNPYSNIFLNAQNNNTLIEISSNKIFGINLINNAIREYSNNFNQKITNNFQNLCFFKALGAYLLKKNNYISNNNIFESNFLKTYIENNNDEQVNINLQFSLNNKEIDSKLVETYYVKPENNSSENKPNFIENEKDKNEFIKYNNNLNNDFIILISNIESNKAIGSGHYVFYDSDTKCFIDVLNNENKQWGLIKNNKHLSDKLESKKFGKVVTIFKIDDKFKDDILDLEYISF